MREFKFGRDAFDEAKCFQRFFNSNINLLLRDLYINWVRYIRILALHFFLSATANSSTRRKSR